MKTATKTPNRATPESIVLNEFLPQARSDWNEDGKVDSGDEFIEIKNLGYQALSISGWKLDDQEGDSPSYAITNVTLQPGARRAFFASETGILLGNGGDSVRLYKSSGQIADVFTYTVVKVPDQTWCRLPDGTGAWKFGCEPTVGEANKIAESVLIGNRVEAAICLSKKLPMAVYLAECVPLGLEMWNPVLWDALLSEFPRYFDMGADEMILD